MNPAYDKSMRRRGVLLIEAAVALAVLAIITALAVSATLNFAKVQSHYHHRMAAAWAADAQMQRLLAGATIDSEPPADFLPVGVTLTTSVEPGAGSWKDFELVTVSARIQPKHDQAIVETVKCYLPREVSP